MAERAVAPLPQYRRAETPTPVSRAVSFAGKIALAAGYGVLVVLLPPQRLFLLAIPIVVMLLLTLWMLPDRKQYSFRTITALFVPLVVTQIIWPQYIAVSLPGLPWMTPTRLILFALSATFLYSLATSSALRAQALAIASDARAFWIAFVVWEVMQFITIPVSPDIGQSAKKAIDNQFEFTCLFFIGCIVFYRPGWARKISLWLIVLAAICCIDGLIEQRNGAPPWAGHIPSFLRVDDNYLATVLGSQARSADGIYRVRGPFSNSLTLAEYLACCMPFILHWLFRGKSVAMKALLGLGWLLVVVGIVITTSRLGLVGALIGHIVYLALWAYRRAKTDTGTMAGPAAVVGAPIVIALALALILSSNTLTTKFFGGGAQQASNAARDEQLAMAIPKVAANPFGHGLGMSGGTLGFVSPSGIITVDNYFITTVLDLGVVGLAAFVAMWLTAAATAARVYLRARDDEMELAGALAAMFVTSIIVRWVFSQEDNLPLFFILIGMTMALRARAKAADEADKAPVVDAAATKPGPVRKEPALQRA